MKIGKHTYINTTNISDAAVIEIGEKAIISPNDVVMSKSRKQAGQE